MTVHDCRSDAEKEKFESAQHIKTIHYSLKEASKVLSDAACAGTGGHLISQTTFSVDGDGKIDIVVEIRRR